MRKEIKVLFIGFRLEERQDIEKEISKLLKSFEFRPWASGYNIKDKIRDISYSEED